jgi:hypothetical protein
MKKKNVSTESSSGSVAQSAIDSCVADLGRHTVTMSAGATALSAQERKRMPRPRKDGASIAREIAQLATKYGVDGIVDVNGMLSAVTQSEQLAPLDKVASNFSVLVHDRAFAADSAAWKSATTGYTVLKRLAKDNPDMARDLVGVTASLKHAKSAATAKSGKPAAATAAKATVKAATPEPAPEPAAATVTPQASPAATQA